MSKKRSYAWDSAFIGRKDGFYRTVITLYRLDKTNENWEPMKRWSYDSALENAEKLVKERISKLKKKYNARDL